MSEATYFYRVDLFCKLEKLLIVKETAKQVVVTNSKGRNERIAKDDLDPLFARTPEKALVKHEERRQNEIRALMDRIARIEREIEAANENFKEKICG